ncbi:GH116 family glycosyl hydrolase [Paenibacillus sp. D2_2]|uniref:GH116 family glycosyl hydrolase n=1 Tax=Paenibacillus sp. D2_2 TaxID=3073092 RepID=UPI0028160DB7|nr:GH116 family glycosyl hydrolase [Paenibacillus sp. D2_2]WMT39751.1 GH116 family glycosyl hydrolase [Paenibacillus sp. D2_2]
MFGSTLPSYVIDALASNITVLRSTTCFRIEDGTLLGWEGGMDHVGSCEGTCTHVWNYAQTLAFLFPELERTMRRVEFLLETDEEGCMAFRTNRVFGGKRWDMIPAADGQMGTIIRLYREWKLSGDDEFLQEVWEQASRALDFAFAYWDLDGDYVLDAEQHNTYDIEFQGPNSLTNSMFYAALKAGIEMADYLGDDSHTEKYRLAFEQGSTRMDEMLWGGEYYIQQLEDINDYRYQYGTGCLSDQLFGQLMAHVVGLGYVLSEEHVKQAVYSIYKYNFLTNFTNHSNVQRTFALNEEKGLLLCSWPHGGQPKLPFVYSDEVWTGIEYQVAAHLIYESYVQEGLTVVKAVRERFEGFHRNPWNEMECGHHYARSMSSWAVLTALSGFSYDMVNHTMAFAPKLFADHYSCFWSTGTAWGIYKQQINAQTGEVEWDIEVLYGELREVQVNGSRIISIVKE